MKNYVLQLSIYAHIVEKPFQNDVTYFDILVSSTLRKLQRKDERKDNFTCHKRTCEFRKLGKRENPNQFGGGEPKRQRMDILQSESQALEHTTDKFTINLEQLDQTPETIIDILKNNVMDLKSTIEVEMERKRALKIIVALHVTFHQATDPTFLSEPPPVFKSLPVEILVGTDIDEVLHLITDQLLKKIDDFEER